MSDGKERTEEEGQVRCVINTERMLKQSGFILLIIIEGGFVCVCVCVCVCV